MKIHAESVSVRAAIENNRNFTEAEVKSLAAFLGSLSGALPEQKPPKLP